MAVTKVKASDLSLAAGLAGDASNQLALDIPGLTEETAVDPTADQVVIYDASAAALRKVLLNNLVTVGSIMQLGVSQNLDGSPTLPNNTVVPLDTLISGDDLGFDDQNFQWTLPAGTWKMMGFLGLQFDSTSHTFAGIYSFYDVTNATDVGVTGILYAAGHNSNLFASQPTALYVATLTSPTTFQMRLTQANNVTRIRALGSTALVERVR